MDQLHEDQLVEVLAALDCPKALSIAACTNKALYRAAQRAFRHLYSSTGRTTSGKGTSSNKDNDWRRRYFEQTFALEFNGLNDYVELPKGLAPGFNLVKAWTLDIAFLAHPTRSIDEVPASAKQLWFPVGGDLLSCQDREFGRARRPQRLNTITLLGVQPDGGIAVGISGSSFFKTKACVADGAWHRISLVHDPARGHVLVFLDGDFLQNHWMPRWYSDDMPFFQLGCGFMSHHPDVAAQITAFNCNSFYGRVDELRVWTRALSVEEIKQCAWSRVQPNTPIVEDMVACWSLTEGKGSTIHSHINANGSVPPARLAAVQLPYGSQSRYAALLGTGAGAEAYHARGPSWHLSNAEMSGAVYAHFPGDTPRKAGTWQGW